MKNRTCSAFRRFRAEFVFLSSPFFILSSSIPASTRFGSEIDEKKPQTKNRQLGELDVSVFEDPKMTRDTIAGVCIVKSIAMLPVKRSAQLNIRADCRFHIFSPRHARRIVLLIIRNFQFGRFDKKDLRKTGKCETEMLREIIRGSHLKWNKKTSSKYQFDKIRECFFPSANAHFFLEHSLRFFNLLSRFATNYNAIAYL